MMKKRRIIIPVGIPASGKSTLREKILREHPETCIVSPDDIRMRILDFERTGIDFDPRIEPDVWDETEENLISCLNREKDIYFDATNLTALTRAWIIEKIDKKKYEIVAHHFIIDTRLAIVRNIHRKRKVPENVMVRMVSMLEPPRKYEGFDRITIHHQRPSRDEQVEMEKISTVNSPYC